MERHDEKVDRVDRQDERVEDLQISDAEARDVAGGAHRKGRKKNIQSAGIRQAKKEA
jgi:hypothetical protein